VAQVIPRISTPRNSSCVASANWSEPRASTNPPIGGGGLISSLVRMGIRDIL
jgi:hypothetical protein